MNKKTTENNLIQQNNNKIKKICYTEQQLKLIENDSRINILICCIIEIVLIILLFRYKFLY